jgi:hypothetical protein
MTNTHLRARVAVVAQGIRALEASGEENERSVFLGPSDPNASPDQKRANVRATFKAFQREVAATNQGYRARYKADAIALRDEMLSRIRGSAPTWRLRAAYEQEPGTDADPLEAVATDFELLARKLRGP